MIIRKAKIRDAEEICVLRRDTFEKINAKDYSFETVKALNEKSTIEGMIKKIKEREMFCLIDLDKKIAGVVDLEGNKIGGLFIRVDLIGKGYGKRLMNFIEDYARKNGIKQAILFSTVYAEDFYRKLGYKLISKKNNNGSEINYKEIKMEKEL